MSYESVCGVVNCSRLAYNELRLLGRRSELTVMLCVIHEAQWRMADKKTTPRLPV